MSKILMVPRKVAEFDKDFNTISLDLVKKIQRQRNPETNVISDTADFFMKWSFECKCQLLGIYKNKKNIKNVTRCRDSRSATRIETR